MKIFLKRIKATVMIEAIFLFIIIMIGCHTILKVTKSCKNYLVNLQTLDINEDVCFVADKTSECLSWSEDYHKYNMQLLETIQDLQKYKVQYKNKVYMVELNEDNRWIAKSI